MPRVGFELTTPVFQRAKTVHALGRVSTVIGKVKLSLQQAVVEAHRIVRRRGSHIFKTIGSQMAMRSALRARHPLAPGKFLVLISVRG
jgi:hypothetical protein